MTILITGATGHLGRLVVENLLTRGVDPLQIVAGARDTTKIADLVERGVRSVHLDYSDSASIAAALRGADTVLLVSSSEVGKRTEQHRAVVDAAKAAGVSKFVYTSAPRATTSNLVLAPEHKATEEAVAASGLPAVILRNNWYTENYAAAVDQAAKTGVLVASAGDGRVASASRRDYADAAATALLSDGHIGAVYELGGDVAWNYAELAAAISDVVGRKVEYRALSTDEHAAELRASGLDDRTATFLTELDAGIRDGALAHTDGTLARLIGRPTTPLVDGLRSLS
ncbi:SDR family oxidoreductase [Tsukamurella sp. DT100]|uniref:SDR family oxidoreductase n=1 Tax=Tsukamurella sp. DT100 TaxID=3393415 RepID=UPI003CF477DD